MPVEDFIFQVTEDGSYVRKLFGVEIIMAHTSETLTAGKPLTVTDTIFCVRTRMDCCSCFAFTIKGELSCHFSTTLDHHTSEEFEAMISAFVDWATVLSV